MLAVVTLLAQTTTQPVTIVEYVQGPNPTTWAGVAQTVATIVASFCTVTLFPFLLWYLKTKASEANANAQNNSASAEQTAEQTRSLLADRLKRMAAGVAYAVADKRFPILAKEIADGRLTNPQQVKDELKKWGDYLHDEIITQMNAQGIDVIAMLGENYVRSLVDRAAAAVSPFPGKDTAVAMLDGGAQLLLNYGVDYLRTVNKVAPPGQTSIMPEAVQSAVTAANVAALNPLQPIAPAAIVVNPTTVLSAGAGSGSGSSSSSA